MKKIAAALTIAGSDSGGGAGIQADLRTFSMNGVFGASVITSVTSQNPRKVFRIDGMDPACVQSQISAVRDALSVSAVKTGMLFSGEIIAAAAEELKKFICPIIVDPVMISTSGSKLLRDDALDLFKELILPIADWVTPNLPEAEFLADMKIVSPETAAEAARKISGLWNLNVVLKGGHAENDKSATDIICGKDGKLYTLSAPRLALPPLTAHGTGCTFSAALAAFTAQGQTAENALISAKAFVLGSLAEARCIGENLYGMFPPSELELYRKQIRTGELPC